MAVEALGDTCKTVLQNLKENKLVLLEANKVEGNHDITDHHVWLVLHMYKSNPFEIYFLCVYIFFPPVKVFSVWLFGFFLT